MKLNKILIGPKGLKGNTSSLTTGLDGFNFAMRIVNKYGIFRNYGSMPALIFRRFPAIKTTVNYLQSKPLINCTKIQNFNSPGTLMQKTLKFPRNSVISAHNVPGCTKILTSTSYHNPSPTYSDRYRDLYSVSDVKTEAGLGNQNRFIQNIKQEIVISEQSEDRKKQVRFVVHQLPVHEKQIKYVVNQLPVHKKQIKSVVNQLPVHEKNNLILVNPLNQSYLQQSFNFELICFRSFWTSASGKKIDKAYKTVNAPTHRGDTSSISFVNPILPDFPYTKSIKKVLLKSNIVTFPENKKETSSARKDGTFQDTDKLSFRQSRILEDDDNIKPEKIWTLKKQFIQNLSYSSHLTYSSRLSYSSHQSYYLGKVIMESVNSVVFEHLTGALNSKAKSKLSEIFFNIWSLNKTSTTSSVILRETDELSPPQTRKKQNLQPICPSLQDNKFGERNPVPAIQNPESPTRDTNQKGSINLSSSNVFSDTVLPDKYFPRNVSPNKPVSLRPFYRSMNKRILLRGTEEIAYKTGEFSLKKLFPQNAEIKAEIICLKAIISKIDRIFASVSEADTDLKPVDASTQNEDTPSISSVNPIIHCFLHNKSIDKSRFNYTLFSIPGKRMVILSAGKPGTTHIFENSLPRQARTLKDEGNNKPGKKWTLKKQFIQDLRLSDSSGKTIMESVNSVVYEYLTRALSFRPASKIDHFSVNVRKTDKASTIPSIFLQETDELSHLQTRKIRNIKPVYASIPENKFERGIQVPVFQSGITLNLGINPSKELRSMANFLHEGVFTANVFTADIFTANIFTANIFSNKLVNLKSSYLTRKKSRFLKANEEIVDYLGEYILRISSMQNARTIQFENLNSKTDQVFAIAKKTKAISVAASAISQEMNASSYRQTIKHLQYRNVLYRNTTLREENLIPAFQSKRLIKKNIDPSSDIASHYNEFSSSVFQDNIFPNPPVDFTYFSPLMKKIGLSKINVEAGHDSKELVFRKTFLQKSDTVPENKGDKQPEKVSSRGMHENSTKEFFKEKKLHEIDMIADRVYKIIERRISIEKDRRGLF